jgi:hypothetical protein
VHGRLAFGVDEAEVWRSRSPTVIGRFCGSSASLLCPLAGSVVVSVLFQRR